MPVIVIAGLARSGKDTAADYIARKYGYAKHNFSSVLQEMVEKRGEKATKEKMISLGDLVRKRMGMDGVAKMLSKKIREKENIVLSGPRSIEEIEYFRKKFANLRVVRVVSGKKQRFARKTENDPKSKNGFFERDEIDSERKGMQNALAAAEFELDNGSTKKSLYSQIDELMKIIP